MVGGAAAPPRRPTVSGHPPTDLGNARRFVDRYHGDLRYVPERDRWLAWDGTRWAPDRSNRHLGLACEIPRLVLGEAQGATPAARPELTRWALTSEAAARINAAVALAKADPRVVVTPERLDAHPDLLNTPGGTIDLRTGEVRRHDPDELHTKSTGVAVGCCGRPAPRWLAFLERILPEPDVRAFVQRALGYSATASVAEQVLFVCHGPGANGKSTLFNVVRSVLGDYAHQAAPDLLLAKHSDSHPTEVAELAARRFVVATETSEGRRLDDALVKRLTGGDPVSARLMRQDFFTFTPTHKLWLGCNHLPRVADPSAAMWRRIRLVPFAVSIPPEDREQDLDHHLVEEEGPEILRWLVDGCLLWRRHGLAPPGDVELATEAYRQGEDHVEQALNDVLADPASSPWAAEGWESSKALMDAYSEWCEGNSVPERQRISAKALGQRLEARGAMADRKKVAGKVTRGWRGVCLAGRLTG